MANPFLYDDPVPPESLIGRAAELDALTNLALEGRNTRLTAPRRYGKTSLIRASLQRCRSANLTVVSVNFQGVVTAEDVVARLDDAYRTQLQGPLRRFVTSSIKQIDAQVGVPGTSVGMTISPGGDARLLDRLRMPLRIRERTGERTVVAFDEFQEVARVSGALPGTFRSAIEQHGTDVAYIFAGSHPGMMRELFADPKHAFFAQASPVPIGDLPTGETIEEIGRRFEEHDRDAGDALDSLVALGGHPQRTMLLAFHLFAVTPRGTVAGPEQWQDALARAQVHVTDEIMATWNGLDDLPRKVVSLVSVGTVKLHSDEASRLFGLSKGSGVARAAERLVGRGMIVETDDAASGYRVVDPLFGLWLRNGRSWPT